MESPLNKLLLPVFFVYNIKSLGLTLSECYKIDNIGSKIVYLSIAFVELIFIKTNTISVYFFV